MPDQITSIRIKLGSMELDYQGEAEFLKQDLMKMLTSLVDLQQKVPTASDSSTPNNADGNSSSSATKLSTSTIARKLRASSGTDLTQAAAAYLAISASKEKFSREEILSEMKTASGIYKASFASNLTAQITRLLNDQILHQVSEGVYSLADKARKEIEEKLAAAG
jgi:hypothetical protein